MRKSKKSKKFELPKIETEITLRNKDRQLVNFTNQVPVVKACQAIIDELNKLMDINAKSKIMQSFIGGTSIGNCFDNAFPDYLNQLTKYDWRHGTQNFEPDNVCAEMPGLNFELKTSSVEKTNGKGQLMFQPIPFAKTNAGYVGRGTKYTTNSVDKYEMCVYCRYHKPDPDKDNDRFKLLNVYVGIYKPSDLKASKGNCGSARLDKTTFDNQFQCIF